MITSHIQGLMTGGYSLSNKLRFGELRQGEFETWVNECYDIISACKPEPYFPCFPDYGHIEEIVMILMFTLRKIVHGEIEYQGLL